MDSMIKEINENLKAIIDNLRETRDNSISTLDNIQIQMDKKVEEAKKYKIQVDSAKEKIKVLEEDNKNLELSLNELSDKYGKMNLVSVVEAGNREIKNKINDNLKEINKEKEHIAELTNKARTIKDLLINLKKDKTVKENRLENTRVVYDYYNDRLNEIIDYAFDHSENLMDYKNTSYSLDKNEEVVEYKNTDLENTMVFDEIANIDDNKNFKDEMTFINNQIEEAVSSNIDSIIKDSYESVEEHSEDLEEDEIVQIVEDPIDTTQVFDTILNSDFEEETVEEADEESDGSTSLEVTEDLMVDETSLKEEVSTDDIFEVKEVDDTIMTTFPKIDDFVPSDLDGEKENVVINDTLLEENVVEPIEGLTNVDESDLNVDKDLFKLNIGEEEVVHDEDKAIDEENEMRINKINDLFANFENNTIAMEPATSLEIKGVEDKIDNAYMDVFGQPIDADDLNKKDPTLTDIFGNPINNDELSNETKIGKKIEELFVENGIDFNKFREDEKNYLKQIYDEEKFSNILNTLKRNKINVDNVYNSFNIFGEISANELESLISKLLNAGQSVEAIGLILEKLPKIKKYNLDEAIMSYGDYIKNVDITELVMKAKELYKNGGNN